MWKSGFLFTATTKNSPQPNVKITTFFHSPCGSILGSQVLHRLSFHIPQPLWRKSVEMEVILWDENLCEANRLLRIRR